MEARSVPVLVTAYGGSANPAGTYTPVSVSAEPWREIPEPAPITEAEVFAYVRRHPRMSEEELAAEMGLEVATVRLFRATAEEQRRERMERQIAREALTSIKRTDLMEDAHPRQETTREISHDPR